jgi:hypothetical protein
LFSGAIAVKKLRLSLVADFVSQDAAGVFMPEWCQAF